MIQMLSCGIYQRPRFAGAGKADFTKYPVSLRAEIKKNINNTLMSEAFLAKIPVSDGDVKALNQIAAEHGENLKKFFAAKGKPMTVTPQAWAMAEFKRSVVFILKLGQEPDEARILRDIRKSFTTPEKTLIIGPRS